jgi:hypothetical protein
VRANATGANEEEDEVQIELVDLMRRHVAV